MSSLFTAIPAPATAAFPAAAVAANATTPAATAQALAFERLLIGQLTQQLAASAGLGGSSGDGLDGTGQSNPEGEALAALVPQALTSAIMADGGIGIAAAIAPSITRAAAASAPATAPVAVRAGALP